MNNETLFKFIETFDKLNFNHNGIYLFSFKSSLIKVPLEGKYNNTYSVQLVLYCVNANKKLWWII